MKKGYEYLARYLSSSALVKERLSVSLTMPNIAHKLWGNSSVFYSDVYTIIAIVMAQKVEAITRDIY